MNGMGSGPGFQLVSVLKGSLASPAFLRPGCVVDCSCGIVCPFCVVTDLVLFPCSEWSRVDVSLKVCAGFTERPVVLLPEERELLMNAGVRK